MKKLYAGLLAIILCGTMPVALVAGEIEKTIISGDANRLRGMLIGIIYAGGSSKGLSLKNLLLDSDSDFDSANKELEDQLRSTLFVPGLLINLNDELREKLSNGLWSQAYEAHGPENNDVLHGCIIRGLQNLKNGGSYLQEIPETIKSKKKLPERWCLHSNLLYFLEFPSEYSNERVLEEKIEYAWDLLEKVLMMSVHVVSRSPKNLLEALEYTKNFEEFPDEGLKMLLPLIGAIFGAKKDEFCDGFGHLSPKKISDDMARFLQGIELVERKEKSFFGKIINKKTILAVLGLGIFLCYHFKLWRVLNSIIF